MEDRNPISPNPSHTENDVHAMSFSNQKNKQQNPNKKTTMSRLARIWKGKKEAKNELEIHEKVLALMAQPREEKVATLLSQKSVFHPVPVSFRGGSAVPSDGSRALLRDVGSERILAMTQRFYEHAFQDKWLDKFIESHADPHGERLGTWIIEKMSGEPVWTNRRPPDARVRAHRAAWHSSKREEEKVGRRFKLDDCRIWMRLMFWSAREEGLDEHKEFFDWYVAFIQHFIGIYEWTAPPYAKESAAWSLDDAKVAEYRANGYAMNDV